MSFMEGFGNAFSKSFSEGMERADRERSDNFKMMYADYLDRRKEQKQKDMDVSWAKNMTQAMGIPQEAWPKLYEMKQSGMDEKTIAETTTNAIWNVGSSGAAKTDNAASPQMAQTAQTAAQVDPRASADAFPTPVDQQMSASGMAPAKPTPQAPQAAPAQPAQPPQPKTMMNGLLGTLSGVFDPSRKQERQRQQGMNRISKVTGASPEQIDATMTGQPTQAIPSAANISFTPQRAGPKIADLQDAYIQASRAEAAYKANPNPQTKAAMERSQLDLKASQQDVEFRAKSSAKAQVDAVGGIGTVDKVIIRNGDGSMDSVSVYKGPDGQLLRTKDGKPVNEAGAQVVGTYNEDQKKELRDIQTSNNKDVEEYKADSLTFPNQLADAEQMIQLATPELGGNANVLKGGISYLARGATSLFNEIQGGAGLLQGMQDSQKRLLSDPKNLNISTIGDWETGNLEAISKMQMPENIRKLAQDSVRYDATRLRYTLNNTPNLAKMTDKDLEKAYSRTEANDPAALRQMLLDDIGNKRTRLNAKAEQVKNMNTKIATFEANHEIPSGFKPFELNLDDYVRKSLEGTDGKGLNLWAEINKGSQETSTTPDPNEVTGNVQKSQEAKAKSANDAKANEQAQIEEIKKNPDQALQQAEATWAKIQASNLPPEEKERRRMLIVERLKAGGINTGGI